MNSFAFIQKHIRHHLPAWHSINSRHSTEQERECEWRRDRKVICHQIPFRIRVVSNFPIWMDPCSFLITQIDLSKKKYFPSTTRGS